MWLLEWVLVEKRAVEVPTFEVKAKFLIRAYDPLKVEKCRKWWIYDMSWSNNRHLSATNWAIYLRRVYSVLCQGFVRYRQISSTIWTLVAS